MQQVSRRTLETIFAHVSAGRIEEAEMLCERALGTAPDDVNIVGMLGAIRLRQERLDEARQLLERAIRLEPGFAKPHEDLGRLHLREGAPDAARRCFEAAIALDDSQPGAFAGLGEALRRLGRDADAAQAFRRHAELSPAARALAEAEALRRDGRLEDAEAACRAILERDPDNLATLRLLAMIASEDDRHVVAEGLLRKILRLSPGNAAAHCDLGRFLAGRHRFPEALPRLEQATQIDPTNFAALLALANVQNVLGHSAGALASYERCLAIEPDNIAALLGRGHMLRVAGRSGEATEAYRRILELDPTAGEAWWNLAAIHGFEAGAADLAALEAALARDDVPAESRVALEFALARVLESRGDYDGAWSHYLEGNTAKRALVRYDPVETEVQFGKIREVFDGELLGGGRAALPDAPVPIFIVGLPRSGTTLIEQILASHSMVEGCGELPYLIMLTTALGRGRDGLPQYPEAVTGLDVTQLDGLGRSYLHHAEAHRREGQAFFTDKMPANFAHLGFIRLTLPQARIIDARRHPMATCVANYRQLFAQGKNQSYDLTELGEYYLQYDALMRHWDRVMPGAVLRVDYEQVVADLEGEVRRMLDFCGLPFETACVEYHRSRRPVNTASAEQVRQPIYDSAVGFWTRYDRHLGELREVLAPLLAGGGEATAES